MIPLLAALMTGYVLGNFIRSPRIAYALCFPASLIVYFLTKILLTLLSDSGIHYPNIEMLVAVGVLQTPVLMLGVFLARRKAKRQY
jgi:hypothetical protein